MNLDQYLNSEGALSVAALGAAIGVPNAAQIRQWRYRYAGRVPSPKNCAGIERATGGLVRCEELRPDLPWHRIKDRKWPSPDGRPLVDVAAEAL